MFSPFPQNYGGALMVQEPNSTAIVYSTAIFGGTGPNEGNQAFVSVVVLREEGGF